MKDPSLRPLAFSTFGTATDTVLCIGSLVKWAPCMVRLTTRYPMHDHQCSLNPSRCEHYQLTLHGLPALTTSHPHLLYISAVYRGTYLCLYAVSTIICIIQSRSVFRCLTMPVMGKTLHWSDNLKCHVSFVGVLGRPKRIFLLATLACLMTFMTDLYSRHPCVSAPCVGCRHSCVVVCFWASSQRGALRRVLSRSVSTYICPQKRLAWSYFQRDCTYSLRITQSL